MATPVLHQLIGHGVVPVVRTGGADTARTAIEWLAEAGYVTFEITLTTPGAVDLIAETGARPDLLIGAGTVTSAAQVGDVVRAGARYVVSPYVVPDVAAACRAHGVACLMGALTPSEAAAALALGVDAVKVFPASSVGPGHLKALRSIFPGVPFMPTGGIDTGNIADYVKAGAVCVGVGGKLLDEAAVKRGDRAAIVAAGRQLLDAYAAARSS